MLLYLLSYIDYLLQTGWHAIAVSLQENTAPFKSQLEP